ncbi:MAG: hypothetical protein A2Z21_02330 [Candidatus Fraserbacteria bacterium RBG_16_55_9]|uniref:Uncharacterized protein n=1 Tax=Fraserbacteria sp. (strain RBG_16_55_9) TaxID=1817864 RepID=A0A1F5V356_FRAXR|nr:MAG: hypothetical protein A2Z21_02330 [Candidatus Fraserbacteria bacterium RBG_16_55_9]
MSRRGIGLLLIGLFFFALSGCGSKEETGETALPKWEDYQNKIQQTLFELVAAKDSAQYAEQRGLDYFTMVRVVIELTPGASLPEGFMVQVESSYENQIQALVSLDKLLELSKQPEIQYIRAPIKPKPF